VEIYEEKKLLRLGSKGVAPSHRNSLRELLKTHKVVKVKVNNRKDGKYRETIWKFKIS
jgi:RNA-binding protein YhbY